MIKIQEAIDEIFFAARHKVIVMLKTEDGIPSKKKAADQLLYEREQRMMTQQEWNYITELKEITEMKKRIREVKNNIIPKIDTGKGVAMIMERIQVMEKIKRIPQTRKPKGDESQGSSCSGEFRSTKKALPEEQIEKEINICLFLKNMCIRKNDFHLLLSVLNFRLSLLF